MSTPSPPYAFLRNALAVAKSSSRISRSIAPCSCRQSSSTSFSPSKLQWSSNNKRAFSSTAFRAKPTPPRKEPETEKGEKDTQKPAEKNDERFYMPPPPEYLQQRIDAAKASMMPPPAPPPQEKPKEAEPTPIPEPENTTGPAAATAAPETLESDRDAGSSAAEQEVGEGETEEVKSAKQEAVAAEEALPSKHQAQRWKLSKRVQERMDELLAQAALVSHKVNNYTGTDYSAIERLRSDIKDQGKSFYSLYLRRPF